MNAFEETAELCENLLLKDIRYHFSSKYLKLDINIPYQEMLEEAKTLKDQFVLHRPDQSKGWKSLVLHGIGPEFTLGPGAYGYSKHKAPNSWTAIAEKCPKTFNFFKECWPNNGYHRIRFMLLEPGGEINWHNDNNKLDLFAATNISLNQPANCELQFRDGDKIPFTSGSSFAFNVFHEHHVRNNSSSPRYHIIVHQKHPAQVEGFRRLILNSYAKEKKICIGVLNNSFITDQSLVAKLTQIAWFDCRVQNRFTIIFGNSIDEILSRSAGYSYCLINELGHHWDPEFLSSLSGFIERHEDFFVMGHIIENDKYFHFDRQTMLINLKYWKQLKRPKFDLAFTGPHHIPIRSKSNVHDDYTPLWLKPGGGRDEINGLPRDSKVISDALDAKLPILNFDTTVRACKRHAYPSYNTEAFSRYFQVWNKQGIDRYQSKFVQSHDAGSKIFVHNTESIQEKHVDYSKSFQTYAGVASGVKLEYIATRCGFDENTRIVFFDCNKDALEFKKYVFDKLSGNNYMDFLLAAKRHFRAFNFAEEHPVGKGTPIHEIQQKNSALFNDEEIARSFLTLRACDVRFVHIDLLDTPDLLLDVIDTESAFIWLSNIYSFVETHFRLPLDPISGNFDTLLALCDAKLSRYQIIGRTSTGVRFCRQRELTNSRL